MKKLFKVSQLLQWPAEVQLMSVKYKCLLTAASVQFALLLNTLYHPVDFQNLEQIRATSF